ncbi:MAG: succinyl-diaminopimelate desuccinylase, partial [Citromicrobium sp.]|nr:succinyl-diaminopimelate desuccinylase [Citromicrobium sp.]
MTDVLDFAKRLIAAPSVTPATGAVFDEMQAMLEPLGFAVHRFARGDGPAGSDEAPVENLFAIRTGDGPKHFAFAGHLDVVPPGEGWASGAFDPDIRGELLYGRGAVDMKGAIACMVDAAAQVPADAGTISFIIT